MLKKNSKYFWRNVDILLEKRGKHFKGKVSPGWQPNWSHQKDFEKSWRKVFFWLTSKLKRFWRWIEKMLKKNSKDFWRNVEILLKKRGKNFKGKVSPGWQPNLSRQKDFEKSWRKVFPWLTSKLKRFRKKIEKIGKQVEEIF